MTFLQLEGFSGICETFKHPHGRFTDLTATDRKSSATIWHPVSVVANLVKGGNIYKVEVVLESTCKH